MKEIDGHQRSHSDTHYEQKHKHELKFVGSIQVKRGMKLFSYNPSSDEMKEVEVRATTHVVFDKVVTTKKEKKAQHNPAYIYFQAINEKNARRKLAKFRAGQYDIAESFEKKEKPSINPY